MAARHAKMLRRLARPPKHLRELSLSQLEAMVTDNIKAVEGAHCKNEIHACLVRLWLLYRGLDSHLGGTASFNRFCIALDEHPSAVTSYLLGKQGTKSWKVDIAHRWACCITKLWLSDFQGPQVDLHLRADGVIRPILIKIEPKIQ